MEDHRIDDIIAELRVLRLQVTHLVTELNRREDRAATALPPTTEYRAVTAPPPTTESRMQRHGYTLGDRLRVLNKIKKPASWDNRVDWSEATARKATVTQFTGRFSSPLTTEWKRGGHPTTSES
jgi:hypothetical protein